VATRWSPTVSMFLAHPLGSASGVGGPELPVPAPSGCRRSPLRRVVATSRAAAPPFVFTAFFARDFWWRYPERAAADFDRPIVEWVSRNGPGSIGEIAPTYSVARRYYEVRAGAPCLRIVARE
jgi:hypothetical protein